LLHPFVPAVQEGRLRRSPFAEAVLDPIERALDVAPPLAAKQRELLGARGLQSGGLHAQQPHPPAAAGERAIELGDHVVQVGADVGRVG
jgi:hypothetical protein